MFDENVQKKVKILVDEKKVKKVNNKIYAIDFMLADELSLFLDI